MLALCMPFTETEILFFFKKFIFFFRTMKYQTEFDPKQTPFQTGCENNLRILRESISWTEKEPLKFLSPLWILICIFNNSMMQPYLYKDSSNWCSCRVNITASPFLTQTCIATFTITSIAKYIVKWTNGSLALHRCVRITEPVTSHKEIKKIGWDSRTSTRSYKSTIMFSI